ncbi:cation:proton antiporter [Saccharothrix sp. NRRL B-16314]|uniref:cation:proton antiporter n=1 Tax=Saccharothrix sp. NRRL B-16314 TaxID=1463825 RepID=UPI0006919079|nr:cation:proton antiporter [Saccharothrix sp. NRRL B-16314]
MTPLNTILFLFALAVVLSAAQLFGTLARRVGQPPVVGEIVAGVLLGPTLFGGAIPEVLFPPDVRPGLTALANVGVAVFMFVIGLELDRRLLRSRRGTTAGVATGSIALPFALGCLLALHLADDHHDNGSRVAFVLFLGASMSITAFPVLARILTDRGMHRTAVGGLALAVAAIGDAVAWVLLAAVLTFTGGQSSWQILLVAPYVLVMLFVVRPVLGALASTQRRSGRALPAGALVGVVVLAVVSGGVTEWLGLHFIFGAFLAGAIVPRTATEALREEVVERVTPLASVLLPVYFAVAGLGVDLSTVDATSLGELALILLVAICGKVVGAYVGARACGQDSRRAGALGVLMNTRGLTELIILGVGLQTGLLDTRLYSLMVVMAVVTTAMTGPLLRLIYPPRLLEADLIAARELTATTR